MRIDPVQVAAILTKEADAAPVRRDPAPQTEPPDRPRLEKPRDPAVPVQKQLNVSIDADKNIIYQFLDVRTGELIQQVPPQEVLQVIRQIADLLRESETRLRVTI